MLLKKEELEIAQFCSEDIYRQALSGIYITSEGTIVTDGHILVRTTVKRVADEDYPKLEGFSSAIPSAEKEEVLQPFILPGKDALEIAKALPKKPTISVLSMAKIDTNYTNSNGRTKIGVTDLASTKVFTPVKIDAEFPDTDGIIKETEQKTPKAEVTLNAELVEKLAKFIRKTSTDPYYAVKISIYDQNEGIRLTWKDADTDYYALLMPIRIPEPVSSEDEKSEETSEVKAEKTDEDFARGNDIVSENENVEDKVKETKEVKPEGIDENSGANSNEGGEQNANSNNGTTSNNKE